MISIPNLPSNIRVPLFYASVDPTKANMLQTDHVALIVGQMIASGGNAGTATPGTVQLAVSKTNVDTLCGRGSQVSRLYSYFKRQNLETTVYILPLADDGAAVVATGSIVVTGPATSSGTIALYIGGESVPVLVTSGMTATQVAAAIAAAINANTNLPVTATSATGTVTVTAKNLGLVGNQIDMRTNYYGPLAGEANVPGVTVTITAMASGTTNPSTGLTTALGTLPDTAYDYVIHPYSDAPCLNAFQTYFSDASGQWSPLKQLYGGAFSARLDTLANLQTLGLSRNDQHASLFGINNCPTDPMALSGAIGGMIALSLSADPAIPLRNVALVGILAPPLSSQFAIGDRNTLLWAGIATLKVEGSQVMVDRAITTYQLNSFGQPDNSMLSVEKMFTLAEGLRQMRGMVETKYGRVKLADDGIRLPPDASVVTPSSVKADLIAFYDSTLVNQFYWFQDTAAFIAGLDVERNATDPDRLDVLWDSIVIDQLNIFALLAQFRQTA